MAPLNRKYPNENGDLFLAEGEYGKNPDDGMWYARPPGCHMGSLADHEVTEHEDGTITVSPSILIIGEGVGDCVVPIQWHGHLVRGEWRSV